MNKPRIVNVNGDEFELHLDSAKASGVLRAFAGTTPLDKEVDALPPPSRPLWLKITVGFLRLYQSKRSFAVETRCVFEPSCSRYAELAFRRFGFLSGLLATLGRLYRCRPGSGGIDLPQPKRERIK